jgi:uncharacterized phage protein (TIGR01671 family)
MNEEIKFRVYLPELSKFVYWSLHEGFDYSDRYLCQDKYPVQQFTRLKDINGKEIYEGDILEENIMGYRGIGVCKSILGGWRVFSHPNCSICWNGNASKIIGNIFENPELLHITASI